MNIGLVGWGIASGNGGMNSDIVGLASWITHWLIPEHPKAPLHQPYIDKLIDKQILHCRLRGDEDICKKFLDAVDGIIYVEHPCVADGFDIVLEAKKRGKIVVGIPMWEWWPERKQWALQTDMLWAVTKFTNRYLSSLSDVLYVHGWHHNWRNRVFGSVWGVNVDDFPFNQRKRAEGFVFVNGNGGYKLRKASDIVFEAFSRPGSPDLTVFTQQSEIIAKTIPSNVRLIEKNFPNRSDVYAEGDVFLFPSYWEGLCHGIYEGQSVGGLVVTTDHPPMSECGTPYLIPVEKLSREDLSGKSIVKAHCSVSALNQLVTALRNTDISAQSKASRELILSRFDLRSTLASIYTSLIGCKIFTSPSAPT